MNLGWMFPSPGFRLQSPHSSVLTTSDTKHFQPPVSFLWFLSVVAMKAGGCCCWVPKALEGDKDELQEVTLSPSGSKETSCEVSLKKNKTRKKVCWGSFPELRCCRFSVPIEWKMICKNRKEFHDTLNEKKTNIVVIVIVMIHRKCNPTVNSLLLLVRFCI